LTTDLLAALPDTIPDDGGDMDSRIMISCITDTTVQGFTICGREDILFEQTKGVPARYCR